MRFAYSPLNIAILTALASQTYANESQISEEIKTNTVSMTPIEVEVKAKQEVGKTVYTKEDLEKTPNSSKNITDFLKVNPNVQFSREQRSADSQAELRPSEISINGAQSYRNKFVINGVNTTNNLDPLASGNSYSGKLDGGSQGIALNTDLICKLELIDSNVSAAYGEFTGGVVNAETCAPNTEIGKIHGSVTYDYTESDWSRYHFTDEEEAAEFEDPTSSNNKEYKKHGLSLNLYSKLSEQ
ncbi:Plug domain-containing protein [Acinetobacter sp. YH12069]|uniref:TonB-dependent receptor plug domain-containing protein n=1 Tax=Acinetobacter sp. YH12069 TaxID=2601065 RepID=UPI0015D1DE89|nr:Plug domain-containing protein [Acinetobacter sp. YH12069]